MLEGVASLQLFSNYSFVNLLFAVASEEIHHYKIVD